MMKFNSGQSVAPWAGGRHAVLRVLRGRSAASPLCTQMLKKPG